MKQNLRVGLGALATTTAFLAVTAMSASADTTDVTFELSSGSLSYAAQTSATLTAGASGATSITGTLGAATVTDARGGQADWSVSALTGAFTNGITTATDVSYDAPTPDKTGTVTVTSAGPTTLTGTAQAVVTGTLVTGNNTATWDPAVTVTLPSSSTAGTYMGTITTSLL